jgi:FkbM family methyltransferase
VSDDLRPTELMRLNTVHGVFYAIPGDLIAGHLGAFGAHTRNELAMVLDHVSEDEVFIDIGAHIGTFAIPIARKVGTRGKVLAIEGCPHNHALLDRNVAANGLAGRIQTVCAIVGDGSQRNLRRVDVEGNTGAGFYAPDPASEHGDVDAGSLICAYGFEQLDFLKIDIEGMEPFVLRSVATIIAARRPKLYVEVSARHLARYGATAPELGTLLRSFGYRMFRNTGERNSVHDRFVKTELSSLEDGGGFFDVLALPE